MNLFLILLLAIGLCFDSFAVSIGAGTICRRFGLRSVRYALILALMQGLMPLLGWLAIGEFHQIVAAWDHWIAFALLAFLGGKMVVSGIWGKEKAKKCDPLSLSNATLMGIATSIDALIAGVALALVRIDIVDGSQVVNMLLAAGVIFGVTFLASLVGLVLGRGVGAKLGARAEILGGVILVIIGSKVLWEHTCHAEQPQCQTTTAMCFNIRYENTFDGVHCWNSRRDAILRMLNEERPVFLGVQEGLSGQIAFLDSALSSYAYVGVGRDDGVEAGEYAAIFYDTTRVRNLQSGNFWLSETPSKPTLGWDAVCVRIASWGQFALRDDADNSRSFFVVNTHFDHVGTVARAKSGELIIAMVDSIASRSPMLLMGDFNCTVQDSSLRPIISKMDIARPDTSTQASATFIGFDGNEPSSLIDHIFTRGIATSSYRVITDSYKAAGGQLSDHRPVIVEICVLPSK